MAYQDSKFSFSIDGIKYSDIKGQYESSYDKIYIRVSGTAQMIRQWIKAKYPQIPLSNYFWIKSRSFANGNAIDIYLNDAPDNIYNELNSELSDKFEYGSYHYGAKQGGGGIRSKTDEGKSIDYGTKYLHVSNNQPYGANSPTVDWNIINNPVSAKTTNQFQSKSTKSTFDKGDFLMDCAGWEIYKKKYADGKILYTAHKKLTTPNNKVDWNTIKGEIYTETGFSYSRFGNFQKWGQIASEAYVINLLCQILGKYYKDPTMTSQPAVVTPPPTGTTGLNISFKNLPPNPKLEFCAINRAEGSYPDDTFPIQFQSFTALTKFIADNIGEMPKAGEGYDKYFISYKWKFEDFEGSDRFDVSEGGENPYKYSNLWAYLRLRNLCYYAWQIGGVSLPSLFKDDEFYANEIGKEGWEINSVQFMSLLSDIIALYPEDTKRFAYNSYKERFDRFTLVYPKLYKIFSENINATRSKEDIQKAIKGLQYLADKGNDKAIKAIKGLEYLLNK